MDRHKEVSTDNDIELDTDRQENVNIGVQYADHRGKVLDTMSEFSEM